MCGAAPFVVGDRVLALFLSFLTYFLIILAGVYIVWLFPVVKNGSMSPRPDVFIRWSTAAASFIHSTLMTSVGVLVVLFENWQSKSIIEGHSPLVPTFVAWEMGHLLQQLMFKCYLMIETQRVQGLTHLMHHGFMIACMSCYTWLGIGDFFFGLYFVSQFSSAFWYLRMLLAKGGKEQSSIYQFVSVMCPVSFVLCRFVPPIVLCIRHENGLKHGGLEHLPVLHVVVIVSVTVYNLGVFVRMLRMKPIRKSFKLS